MADHDNPRITAIRHRYEQLQCDVDRALRSHLGDQPHLRLRIRNVESMLGVIQQHGRDLNVEESDLIVRSLNNMAVLLRAASHQSWDAPVEPPLPPTQLGRPRSGRQGRPRLEIHPDILSSTSRFRGPTEIAKLLRCCPRTVRRRQLEYGMKEPGEPVFVEQTAANGTTFFTHTPTPLQPTTLTDEQLEDVVGQALEAFPLHGRIMLEGYVQGMGHVVTRRRIEAAYHRIRGPGFFGRRQILRRVYKVPGPNSLWHHDGQHGLIRFRIVLHGFIDGYSRLVVGLRAHNNNRSETVLELFLDAVEVHGYPSRVRGDHGTENVGVAEHVELNFGVTRGSYIWGRSVHNVHIERLWYDVTQGLGGKWKHFFTDLEVHWELDINNDAHIWLLHFLFLDTINQELSTWTTTWNSHKLSLKGERNRSPNDMFLFGVLEEGLFGPPTTTTVVEDDPGDLNEYGVDWEAWDTDRLRHHHITHNNLQSGDEHPSDTSVPAEQLEWLCPTSKCRKPPQCSRRTYATSLLSSLLFVVSISMLSVWMIAD